VEEDKDFDYDLKDVADETISEDDKLTNGDSSVIDTTTDSECLNATG